MKVILLQDVAKIGKRYSVTNVPDGYALNQLIPKKMAEPATPANLKRIQQRQATVAAGKEAGNARFDAAVAAMSKEPVVIAVDANEQEHLFQAVHEADIVQAATAAGVSLDASMLKINTPIKSLGSHEVDVVSGEKRQTVTVQVVKK